VIAKSRQEGKTREQTILDRWAWVERSVWTEAMLTALEKGVKGGRWYSLMDKVYTRSNLESAWQQVRKNKGSSGIDKQSIAMFEDHASDRLDKLHEELRSGRYRANDIRRSYIKKTGSKKKRPLGIPTVKDRIVQTALRNAIQPIFERKFHEHSYGYRPRRDAKDALRRVTSLMAEGYHWIVDADIASFFDTIDHGILLDEVKKEIVDSRILGLLEQYMTQTIWDEMRTWTPEQGTPQGGPISPLLSNIYLHPVDMELRKAGYEMVRYADDLVLLCRSEAEAKEALTYLQKLMEERKLKLHAEKTRIVETSEKGGFDFLGYHFERGTRWPSGKSMRKMRDSIREKTKRCNGHSLEAIIATINPMLRGWFNYFKHSNLWVFKSTDGWVRMRLRSILRKRHHGRGRGRGLDHIRWPNKFFRTKGLFTMAEARKVLG
jgi:RNA-directed DNA polymerase